MLKSLKIRIAGELLACITNWFINDWRNEELDSLCKVSLGLDRIANRQDGAFPVTPRMPR